MGTGDLGPLPHEQIRSLWKEIELLREEKHKAIQRIADNEIQINRMTETIQRYRSVLESVSKGHDTSCLCPACEELRPF